MNKDHAVDKLMHSDRNGLAETCCGMHKDQYGVKGRHMTNWTVAQLVSWIVSHYDWNEKGQYWQSNVPFDNDDYSDRVTEADYYAQFG